METFIKDAFSRLQSLASFAVAFPQLQILLGTKHATADQL